MDNYTINTYEMKRDIVKYSKKICEGASKPETKFTTDMIYGIFKAKNIHLSTIAEALNENIKKAYTIDRLSDNLASDLNKNIDNNYMDLTIDSLGDNPIFIIDDSDVTKPLGEKFEDLGIVRDGSSKNKTYEKGYHHTEIIGLTNFEDFRVRTLKSINNLNKMLTYTIGLVALLSEKINKREFVNRIIKESKSLRDKVYLWFYQLARGIYNILKMAKTGIRKWENIRKTKQYNGQLSLV